MRIYAKLAITALVAIAALAALVSSASARNLSISNSNVRVTWTSLEFNGGAGTVRCPVTLEGSFHARTIAKVEKTLMGYITSARVKHESCTGGAGWTYNGSEVLGGNVLPNSLPWHITYGAFIGALPNIERLSILLERARFLVEIFGFRCIYLAGSSNGSPRGTMTREASGGVENLRASSGNIAPSAESPSGGFCPSGTFSSRAEDGKITLLNASTRITVTLI